MSCWTNEYLPTSCELHIASDYLRNSSLCLTDCSLEHIFHFVIGSCQQQKRERTSITEYTLYLHVSTAKGECNITRPELLNCQMQSHLSWLVVISNSSGKKALSKAIWCKRTFLLFQSTNRVSLNCPLNQQQCPGVCLQQSDTAAEHICQPCIYQQAWLGRSTSNTPLPVENSMLPRT